MVSLILPRLSIIPQAGDYVDGVLTGKAGKEETLPSPLQWGQT